MALQDDHRRAVNLFLATRGQMPVAPDQPVQIFYRMARDNQVYHSREYTRVTARNSYTVSFVNEHKRDEVAFGQVQLFVRHKRHDIAVVRLFNMSGESVLKPITETDALTAMLSYHFEDDGILANQLDMAIRVTKCDNLIAIDVKSIQRKWVFIDLGSKLYVSKIPNFIECD